MYFCKFLPLFFFLFYSCEAISTDNPNDNQDDDPSKPKDDTRTLFNEPIQQLQYEHKEGIPYDPQSYQHWVSVYKNPLELVGYLENLHGRLQGKVDQGDETTLKMLKKTEPPTDDSNPPELEWESKYQLARHDKTILDREQTLAAVRMAALAARGPEIWMHLLPPGSLRETPYSRFRELRVQNEPLHHTRGTAIQVKSLPRPTEAVLQVGKLDAPQAANNQHSTVSVSWPKEHLVLAGVTAAALGAGGILGYFWYKLTSHGNKKKELKEVEESDSEYLEKRSLRPSEEMMMGVLRHHPREWVNM
jgi:hypothetical protein